MLGRLVKERDRMDASTAGGNFIQNIYDIAGNMVELIDQEKNSTYYSYDLMNRKTATIYEDGKQTLISYDSIGRMGSTETFTKSAERNADSLRTRQEYGYRYSGVVDKIEFLDGREAEEVGYSHLFDYDEVLRRKSCENELDHVLCEFTYNDRGLMSSEKLDLDPTSNTNPVFTTGYRYDVVGRVASIQYPTIDGEHRRLHYKYTDRGELQTIQYADVAPFLPIDNRGLVETRHYDAGGRMLGVARPAAAGVNETRNYDNASRIEWIDNSGGVGRLNYTYDANNNKNSETWTGVAASVSNWGFSIDNYDAEDRFLDFSRLGSTGFNGRTDVTLSRRSAGDSTTIGNIGIISAANDDSGLELTGTRGFSTTHELQSTGSAGSSPQTFNDEGQLTASHSGQALHWNAQGLLARVEVPANATAGIEGEYTYGYDCDGRRVWQRKTGETKRTAYLHGGPNVITELDVSDAGSASNVKRFAHGTTIDELVLYEASNGTRYGVTRNQQWSVMAMYDLADGTIARRFNYGLFGQRFVCDATGQWSPDLDDLGFTYGYTSRRHDLETGKMYFRARYYDPNTGEFISQDPLAQKEGENGYQDGMSLYRSYKGLNFVDPEGLSIVLAGPTAERNRLLNMFNTLCPQGQFRQIWVLQLGPLGALGYRGLLVPADPQFCEEVYSVTDNGSRICWNDKVGPDYPDSDHPKSCECICKGINQSGDIFVSYNDRGGSSQQGNQIGVGKPHNFGGSENPSYIQLAHELCGEYFGEYLGGGGEGTDVEIENEIRDEHDFPRR